MLFITQMLWLLPPEATSALSGGPASSASPASAGGVSAAPSMWESTLPLLVMFAIFYFLLVRPQQKRQKETDEMLKVLRKGDKVRTSGGIRGEIYELTDTDVTLQIDAKVKINVLRSHIASKIGKPAGDGAGA